jgi:hypothetical protein
MMLFPYCIFFKKKKEKKKKRKKNWEFCSRMVPSKVCQLSHVLLFFLVISSLCIGELFLHIVENISLTYAKFSCSLVMIDSCFSHEMTSCTIQGSSKVCIFLSNFLILGTLYKREVFDKMVKLTKMLVEP